MGHETYDVVVVGGGIVGAGLLHHFKDYNYKVLMVERGHISTQTSARSSKMLHGGLRYLENFDLPLVYEALREKNYWRDRLPEFCVEHSFILPVFNESKRPLWMIRIGLFMYDLLSLFQNGKHKIFSKRKVLSKLPDLKEEGLVGAGVYSDVVVDDARLCSYVINDALKSDCIELQENTRVLDIKKFSDKFQLIFEDGSNVIARKVVFAVGPFTDQLLSTFTLFSWKDILLPSKGSHLWLKNSSINLSSPMLLQLKDGRVLFVIPTQDKILVGTTEVAVDRDDEFYNIEVSDNELNYILDSLNYFFPKAGLTTDDVVDKFAGVRPLARNGNDDSGRGKVSRVHKVISAYPGVWAIVGGKYTTFRSMTAKLALEVISSLKKD